MKFEICMAAKVENRFKDHICIVPTDPLKAIQKVIFNDPATIVYWADGTKTVVKCQNENFDAEKGLAMAISKKFFGNQGNYYNVFQKYLESLDAGDITMDSTKPINDLQTCLANFSRKSLESLDWFLNRLKQI